MKLKHWGGETEVNVGDKFKWSGGDEWEVIGFTDELTYSSSTIGGTPTVRCKALAEMSGWYKQYSNEDGTVDFCGDSVASAITRGGHQVSASD